MTSFFLALPIPGSPISGDFENEAGEYVVPNTTYLEFLEWTQTWKVQHYYLVIVLTPLVISVVQVALLLTCFNFQAPHQMKKNGETEKLKLFMSKLYPKEMVDAKIQEIKIDGDADNTKDVSYKESFCSP